MPRVLNSSPEFCSTSCLILAKSLHLYEPQFPLLQHRVCCEKQWWNNKALLKLWSTIKLWIIKWCFPSQGFQSPLTKGDFSLMPPSWIPVYLSREAVPRSIWETSYSLGFPGEKKRGLNGRREGGKSPWEVHGTPAENQHLSFWVLSPDFKAGIIIKALFTNEETEPSQSLSHTARAKTSLFFSIEDSWHTTKNYWALHMWQALC